MDKKYIDKLLKELNVLEGEYYIVGGASLVLRGIRDVALDLDLCMSPKAYEDLKTRYNIVKSNKGPENLYTLSEEVEFFVEDKENFKMEYRHGYPLEDIHTILNYKIKRNSEKDIKDIINIKKYLEAEKID